MKYSGCALWLALGLLGAPTAGAVDVQAHVKNDAFNDIKLSPNGDYYAATVPLVDRTHLVILRRSDNKVTANVGGGKNTHIADFRWVNPERVILSIAEKFGALDQPQETGELYAVSTNGVSDILVGFRVESAGPGTKIQPKKVEAVAAYLVDDLPGDDKNVIVTVRPFGQETYSRAELLDVYTGRRTRITTAPVRNAAYFTDNAGAVRFASGFGTDNVRKLYYRSDTKSEWRLLSDEGVHGGVEWPIGFSANNTTAYFTAEQRQGPDAIVAFDIATEAKTQLLRDDDVDPWQVIYRGGTEIPVGMFFMDGKPRTAFFDDKAPEAKLYRNLEAAFGGEPVRITSQTSDGNLALVQAWSDRNPGDFYVFDTVKKKAEHLLSRRDWFDPAQMGEMRPIKFPARDGLVVHGYLTLPNGSSGKNLPMVVMPHGGPFGVQDVWGFHSEAQMLAKAGYAVLQLNFRGSAGYGQAYKAAGARQWGGAMQDDLTDSTRWAIQQGIADSKRICIYGGSYGGYAALMGVAKEQGLYQCAIGYVGVYDLPMMQSEDTRNSRRVGNWSAEWVGDRAALGAVSPNRIAERIKVPVFLAAGGEDEVAPIEHSKLMESALRKAGVPVETLYYPTEGHGFYQQKNRTEYYTRLLAFLARHLGGATATTGASGTTAK